MIEWRLRLKCPFPLQTVSPILHVAEDESPISPFLKRAASKLRQKVDQPSPLNVLRETKATLLKAAKTNGWTNSLRGDWRGGRIQWLSQEAHDLEPMRAKAVPHEK